MNKLTFTVYKYPNFKKSKEVHLVADDLVFIFCSGVGCEVRRKKGRPSHYYWMDSMVQEHFKEFGDSNRTYWFLNDESNIALQEFAEANPGLIRNGNLYHLGVAE